MPMLEVKSRDYQERIETAVFKAIMEVSIDKETNTASLLTGEIVQACLNTIAMVAGTSDVMRSPTTARKFGDECSRTIRTRALEVRRLHAEGQTPFAAVIHASDRH